MVDTETKLFADFGGARINKKATLLRICLS